MSEPDSLTLANRLHMKEQTEKRRQLLAQILAARPLAYSEDQERDEQGRFTSGGGGGKGGDRKEGAGKGGKGAGKEKGGKSKERTAAEKKVEKAQAALQKAKDGLAKAKKELSDVRTREKAQTAASRGATSRAASGAKVDASKQIQETLALHDRYADRSVKVEDINKHVENLGKTSNKAQVVAVAKELDIHAPSSLATKEKALKAIRQKMTSRKGVWVRVDA